MNENFYIERTSKKMADSKTDSSTHIGGSGPTDDPGCLERPLPYAWDREIKNLVRLNLPADTQAMILGENACEFYSINMSTSPK